MADLTGHSISLPRNEGGFDVVVIKQVEHFATVGSQAEAMKITALLNTANSDLRKKSLDEITPTKGAIRPGRRGRKKATGRTGGRKKAAVKATTTPKRRRSRLRTTMGSGKSATPAKSREINAKDLAAMVNEAAS